MFFSPVPRYLLTPGCSLVIAPGRHISEPSGRQHCLLSRSAEHSHWYAHRSGFEDYLSFCQTLCLKANGTFRILILTSKTATGQKKAHEECCQTETDFSRDTVVALAEGVLGTSNNSGDHLTSRNLHCSQTTNQPQSIEAKLAAITERVSIAREAFIVGSRDSIIPSYFVTSHTQSGWIRVSLHASSFIMICKSANVDSVAET